MTDPQTTSAFTVPIDSDWWSFGHVAANLPAPSSTGRDRHNVFSQSVKAISNVYLYSTLICIVLALKEQEFAAGGLILPAVRLLKELDIGSSLQHFTNAG